MMYMTKPLDAECDCVNMNQLAQEICMREGGKVNLSIAQIKEVLRIFAKMYQMPIVGKIWLKYVKRINK